MEPTRGPAWGRLLSKFAGLVAGAAERIAGGAGRAREFWERMTEGQALHELWAEFRAETRATYGLYSGEVDWAAIDEERGWKRSVKAGRALFWALLMRLSPSRRVFLLITLALAVLAVGSSPNKLSLLATAGLLLLVALELADRVTMKRDLEIAREIQRWLVPSAPPRVAGVDIAFATRPANTVSGDYYDAFLRPRGTGSPGPGLLVGVADVAGKSVPAALLMATIQASLRTLAAAPASLPELVRGLNRYASAHSLGGARFTTAFLAELDPASLELSYINAGHNPPVLRRAGGQIERLEAGGLPLGILPEAAYECGHTVLCRGDLLAILTDGVAEAENERGVQYGEARLLEQFVAPPQRTAAEELQRIMSAVDAFVGRARQHDDITCLVLLLPA